MAVFEDYQSLFALGQTQDLFSTDTSAESRASLSNIMTIDRYSDIEPLLLSGDLDTAILPWSHCPLQRHGDVVVTAVSSRVGGDCLMLRREIADRTKIFLLPERARVCARPHVAPQIREIRSDWVLTPHAMPHEKALDQLKAGLFDALVAPLWLGRTQSDLLDLEIIPLDPSEIAPAPVQDVTAWLAHAQNLPLRRALKALHNSETARCGNVERGFLHIVMENAPDHSWINPSFGAYCMRDDRGMYHAYAGGLFGEKIMKARVSSSTWVGLDRQLWHRLEEV